MFWLNYLPVNSVVELTRMSFIGFVVIVSFDLTNFFLVRSKMVFVRIIRELYINNWNRKKDES
jgi:hypothetical protein